MGTFRGSSILNPLRNPQEIATEISLAAVFCYCMLLWKLIFDEEKIKPKMWPVQGYPSLPIPAKASRHSVSFAPLEAGDGHCADTLRAARAVG